ncbi:MAG: PDR/VanB family oxidoreductase [Microlunatus sp.]|nr:PDR/VanB family oxidoreductase [Microlunatus sp.]
MRVTHDEQRMTVRVRSITWEADGVVSVEFVALDGSDLPAWEPGAHLDLELSGVITRQYSLCGDPARRSSWRIAVLREPVSKGGSQAVHERLRPGDVVTVVGPRNNFPLTDAPAYRFVAGGIGITPLLPMMRRATESGAEWTLLYGGRSRTSMAFVDEVEAYGERVQIRPQDEFGLLDLQSLLGTPETETLVYCCGPEPLLNAVEASCSAWRSGALRVERFKPKPQPVRDPGAEQAFVAVLQRSGYEVDVPAGTSILEAIEECGLEADHSCREGVCGTCEAGVVAGVPDHRDSLLSSEEQAANESMMICVGRALSERIVLDI